METNAGSPAPSGSLDRWFARAFGDAEPTSVGSGWPGGVVAVLAGALALGGVLCLRFPATLTAPALRAIYPLAAVRLAIGALVAVAFALGAASALLRRRKVLGATGIALGVAALSLGGPRAAVPAIVGRGAGIGLDWFLLNTLVMTAAFVPLERWAPRDPALPVFRRGWSTDAMYTFVGHASIQVVSALVVLPGRLLRDRVLGAAAPNLGALPLWAQLPLVLVVADLAFYWIHRAMHHFPFLWRLHRLHHSSESMDWLASERLHLAEIVIVRAVVLVPLTVLGFAQTAVLVYVTFASFHAVFVHANFRPALEWLEPALVTPRLHHLHHATDADAIDKNFAIHLPILDRLFGTLFAPEGRWPARTGVVGFPAPDGYWRQQASVFARPGARLFLLALVTASALALPTAPARADSKTGAELDPLPQQAVRPRRSLWPSWEVDGDVIAAAEAASTPESRERLVPVLVAAGARHALGYDRLRDAVCTPDVAVSADRASACARFPAYAEYDWARSTQATQRFVRVVATVAYAGAITATAVEREHEAGRTIATAAGVPIGVSFGIPVSSAVLVPLVGSHCSPGRCDEVGSVTLAIGGGIGGTIVGGVVGALVARKLAASPGARVPVTTVALAPVYLTTLVMTLD